MADPRPAQPANYPYGLYKNSPGTVGTSGVNDTFFGPRDKVLVDFHARDATRLRGTNLWFYVLESHNRRIDGDRPLSDSVNDGRVDVPEGAPEDPFRNIRHSGFALYGENVIVGERLDSVRREMQPDWPFLDPILVRGVIYEVEHEEESDERGSIYVRRCSLDLARVLCDKEWMLQPRVGDVVRLPRLNDVYMDVSEVARDETRFGGTGFFATYKLTLSKSSRYEPQRKIAVDKQTDVGVQPPPQTGDPNPGKLS